MKPLLYALIVLCSISTFSQNEQCACCTENHDDFDFWVGEWSVTDNEGKLVGTSVIDKIQNNCILRENWKGLRGGYTGTSFNFYNSINDQWEQVWIDNGGNNLQLQGERIDNQMILRSADLMDDDGHPLFHRITWTKNEDGTVRQLWEMVTNGTEIAIAFDGLYSKNQ